MKDVRVESVLTIVVNELAVLYSRLKRVENATKRAGISWDPPEMVEDWEDDYRTEFEARVQEVDFFISHEEGIERDEDGGLVWWQDSWGDELEDVYD